MSRTRLLTALLALTLTACLPQSPTGGNDNNDENNDRNNTSPDAGEDTDPGDDGGQTGTNNEPLPDGDRVSVATLNVQFLFDTNCDSGRCGEDDFEEVLTQLELDSKLTRLRRALTAMDADVIVLQEIETEEVFEDAIEDLEGYPTSVFGETGGSASLDVGLVSRYPIIKTVRHRNERIPQGSGTTTFARELLEVHLQGPGGRRVVAMTGHFISQRSDSDARREAEGTAAAKYAVAASEENPSAFVVLAGDFNGGPESNTLRNMYDEGMASANRSLSTDDFYTFVFAGNREALDHVLYVPGDDIALDPSSVESLHDSGRSGFGGSDHAAARAEFILVD